ncbi:MAG: ABC transporter permease [Theionarchaea archaeon]|nr:ABC transporter permease [Theionarchaea archaeon]MBU6999556.1 ABC transporter permease [Theionarchaea archaeon]MBU7020280.1 ABC transporter permease [Theionarchaea archaeon]MBU7035175.1 ABC transporter permease [Theionarchaea archaeon]MBU7041498.1 ABC transporter permease [Theionarchaea archaeon]
MFWKAVYVICLRDIRRFFREKSQVIGSIARPALWLAIMGTGFNTVFSSSGSDNYAQFLFPGIIGMTVLFTSVFSAVSVIWDRQFGFLREMLVAPVSRTSIAVGKTLSGCFQSLIQGSIIMVLSFIVDVHLSPLIIVQVLAIILLASFALTSMGLLIASRMPSFEGFNLIMNFLVMPMFLMSGAFFPISGLPAWMKSIVTINPLSYGVDALRGVILGFHEHALTTDILFMAGFAIIMTAVAVTAFNKAE